MPPVPDNPLFFLDYDGTLAPLVDDPMQAFPHRDVPELLLELEKRGPTYIVTGRHLQDVAVLMPESELPAIGLHGALEGRLGNEETTSLLPDEAADAIAALRQSAPEHEDLRLEEKGPVFAVHYRHAADKEAARGRLRGWLTDLPETLEAIWGKDVVEVRARGVHKGAAVARLAAEHPDHTPIYLGDDVTDEDAFRALEEHEGAVTIKVGEGETRAAYRLAGPDEVVAYLKRFVRR